MNILNLILTTISLILSIISDVISIQSKKKLEKITKDSRTEITYVTTETKFMKKKTIDYTNN